VRAASEGLMDWIERLLGLYPDAGNGSAECAVAAIVTIAAVTLFASSVQTRRMMDRWLRRRNF
jgi:hypothetical protein